MSLGSSTSLLRLQAGDHVGLALALRDQLRTSLALRVDRVEGTR
jgi:hypothetical protein